MAKTKTHLDCSVKEDAIARERALTTKTLGQCYLEAGYSSKVKEPRVAAAAVLNKPHVQERVDYYRSMMAAKLDIRAERILAEFAAIAFADPLDAFDMDEGGYLQIKPLDRMPPWARRSIMSIKTKRRILDGAGENLRCGGAEAVDEHYQRALVVIAFQSLAVSPDPSGRVADLHRGAVFDKQAGELVCFLQ